MAEKLIILIYRNMQFFVEAKGNISGNAFTDEVVSYMYTCNGGTAGTESIGQAWANVSGGKTYAFVGKTDYAGCSDNSLLGKISRNLCEIIFGVSAYGGNTVLPQAGNDAYCVEFCPE